MRSMANPVARVFMAASIAGAVMIGAVLFDSTHDKPSPASPEATASASKTAPEVLRPPAVDAPPPAAPSSNASAPSQDVSDAQILALLAAHPELRASIEALMNEPDPNVRQESAALVLELAAAAEQTRGVSRRDAEALR
jgi:hypothetical protein